MSHCSLVVSPAVLLEQFDLSKTRFDSWDSIFSEKAVNKINWELLPEKRSLAIRDQIMSIESGPIRSPGANL